MEDPASLSNFDSICKKWILEFEIVGLTKNCRAYMYEYISILYDIAKKSKTKYFFNVCMPVLYSLTQDCHSPTKNYSKVKGCKIKQKRHFL